MVAMITSEEYKNLILTEEKYNQELKNNVDLIIEKNILKGEIINLEQELKELLLIVTGNKERASYMEYEFSEYDLADRKEVTEYINKNYMNNGVLKFRKLEETKEEGTNE